MTEKQAGEFPTQLGRIEIGSGPWQRLGQLLDQIGTPEKGARYLRSTKLPSSGMVVLDIIEAGGIEKVVEQLAAATDTSS